MIKTLIFCKAKRRKWSFNSERTDQQHIFNRQWPSVTVIVLKKKTKATKCSDHRTSSFMTDTAKIIAKILKRRIGMKLMIYVEK